MLFSHDSNHFPRFPMLHLFSLFRNAHGTLPTLPELGSAPTHNLTLANQLSVELTAIKSEVDVEVHAVKRSLRRIHPLEILLEILPRQIGGERDDLFNACLRNCQSKMLTKS